MLIDTRFLGWLRRLGFVEGVSTLILFFIAMPMKYLAGMPMAVTVVGSIHGLLFVALCVAFAVGWARIPLPWTLAAAGVVGAVVPFGPFVVDRWLARLVETPAAAGAPVDNSRGGLDV